MPSFSITTFLSVGLMIALLACSSPEEREAQHLANGKSLMESGDLLKASIEFRNALQINPAGIEAKYYIGLIFEKQGNIPAAASALQEVAFSDSTHRDALLRLGKFSLMAANPGDAIVRADRLLELDGPRADALTMRAAAFLMKGKLAEAKSDASKALAIKPYDEDALIVLASESARRNNLSQAQEIIQNGLDRAPQSAQLLAFKLKLLYDQGFHGAADAVLHELATLEPANIHYVAPLAARLAASGKLSDAQELFRRAIQASTEPEQMASVYADFLQQAASPQQAIDETASLAEKYNDNPRYRFLAAQLYMKLGRYDDARQQLNDLAATLATPSDKLEARTELARIDFMKGDKGAALTQLDSILKDDSRDHNALLLRAAITLGDSRFDASVADARSVLRDVPNSTSALSILARAYVGMRENELAVSTLRTLAALDPTDSDARLQLAGLLAVTSPAEAIQYLDAAIAILPERRELLVQKAQLLIYSKKWDQAEVIGRSLLAVPATVAPGHQIIGEAAYARKDYRTAVREFREALHSGADFSVVGRELMASYAAMEKSDRGQLASLNAADEASKLLTERIARNPKDVDALVLLAARRQQAGKLADAEDLLRAAVAAGPNNHTAYLDLALLLKTQGKIKEALDILVEAASRFPNDRVSQESVAMGYELAQSFDAARASYEKVLAKWPDSVIAANNLAGIVADIWPHDKAQLELARDRIEKYRNSHNAVLIDTLGWVYLRLGNINEATYLLEKASTLDPDNKQILYHYAEALSQKGLNQKAKMTLEQALTDAGSFRGLAEAKTLADRLR